MAGQVRSGEELVSWLPPGSAEQQVEVGQLDSVLGWKLSRTSITYAMN